METKLQLQNTGKGAFARIQGCIYRRGSRGVRLIVNSNDEPVSVNLNVLNYITYVQNEKWVLQGTGAADPNPILTQGNPASYEGGEVSLTLDPYSVTVIALTPAAE